MTKNELWIEELTKQLMSSVDSSMDKATLYKLARIHAVSFLFATVLREEARISGAIGWEGAVAIHTHQV